MSRRIFLFGFLFVLILAGCSGGNDGGRSGAVRAVESYYKAIIDQNADQLSSLTCANFEEKARTELDSFQGVKTELQGFSCQETGKQGDATLVKCSGKIVASYGNEKMDFPLADRVHQVKNEGGDWRVCGY